MFICIRVLRLRSTDWKSSLSVNANLFYVYMYYSKLEAQIKAIIIQQIVTLSKYGHDALDICHP